MPKDSTAENGHITAEIEEYAEKCIWPGMKKFHKMALIRGASNAKHAYLRGKTFASKDDSAECRARDQNARRIAR